MAVVRKSRGHIGSGQGSIDNVVNGSMAVMAAHTPTAAKSMSGEMVHFRATMLASVGLQRGTPSLRPTATRIVLLSILRPREEMGRTFSQAPDSVVEAARR